ncbi:MAG: hypothetical protein E7455_09745 [Ruminococcaceae bacterium]|nr:hypothetical protein [Oscillospiraceae bacterium]
MKRLISLMIVLLMCVSLLAMTASATTASATLTGPGTVRAGDTITLTFNLSGSGLYSASGTLSYDSSQLTLVSTSQKIGGNWSVDFNGNNFVAIDTKLSKPIQSSTALFSVTFKVKSSLAVGTKISVSCTDVVATDGNTDADAVTATYSATIAAPMSTDNNLKSLTVSNATISPAFNANTTSYTAEVPFEVSKLDVKATANDSKATVSINNPDLTPNGTTKVTVTVKAENGSTKTYTITVKRAQDPNYVASGNNDLSGISVDGFLLSPVFSADNTKYVIWLPYETENVTVSGTAADSRANVRVEGGNALIAGADNEIKVICTAENGAEKVYTVIAKRAASHDASTEPSEPATEPSEAPTTAPTTAPTEPETPAVTEPQNADVPQSSGGVQVWLVVVIAIACLAVGTVGGILSQKVGKKKSQKY